MSLKEICKEAKYQKMNIDDFNIEDYKACVNFPIKIRKEFRKLIKRYEEKRF